MKVENSSCEQSDAHRRRYVHQLVHLHDEHALLHCAGQFRRRNRRIHRDLRVLSSVSWQRIKANRGWGAKHHTRIWPPDVESLLSSAFTFLEELNVKWGS